VTPTLAEAAAIEPAADWTEFAEYIRANPSGMSRTPADLAQEFGIDEDFVRSFLSAMRAPVEQESFLEIGARAIRESLSKVGRVIRKTFEEITSRPWICLLSTTGVSFGILVMLSAMQIAWGLGENFATTGAAGALFGSVVVLGVSLQGVCYYRHALVRYAFASTGVVFAGWLIFLFWIVQGGVVRGVDTEGVPVQLGLIMASGLLALLYFLFALTVTLFGSYSKYRRDSREEGEVSRQELLDRLFMLDHRLTQIDSTRRTSKMRWVDRLRTSRTFFLNVMFAGLAIGMIEVVIFGTFTRFTGRAIDIGSQMPIPVFFLAIGIFAMKMALGLISGFVAGRPGRAMSALFAMIFGIWIAYWFPLGIYGPKMALGQLSLGSLLQGIFSVVIFGTLTGYAALVEDRNYRAQKLRTDDLPSLLAEQVQIHWRLGLGQQAATVMVVDVAKSTEMKSKADALKVEWSFREYQTMVDEICRTHGGHVFSTAGDGAVVRFQRSELAVLAAREILTMLPKFNMRRNRLDTPFRLRVGIHAGNTEANLVDAPFNEVIDIAAHIEAAAPVGGIAVSKVVADTLAGSVELAEMARTVDGQQVFIVLNPTLETE
jgi:class 3 adenylate cyclase